jgi:hypothetical protein
VKHSTLLEGPLRQSKVGPSQHARIRPIHRATGGTRRSNRGARQGMQGPVGRMRPPPRPSFLVTSRFRSRG